MEGYYTSTAKKQKYTSTKTEMRFTGCDTTGPYTRYIKGKKMNLLGFNGRNSHLLNHIIFKHAFNVLAITQTILSLFVLVAVRPASENNCAYYSSVKKLSYDSTG